MPTPEDQPPFLDVNDPANRRAPLSSEELLPQVEPPSVGFLFQLFIIPAVIVGVLFGGITLLRWTVFSVNRQPEQLVEELQRPSVHRGQTQMELADVMRNPRYAAFLEDRESARKLAQLLEGELDRGNSAGAMEDDAVTFRYFLCRTLGEFHVTEGLPALCKAALTNRDEREEIVQRGAIEGIAVIAQHQHDRGTPETLDDPELMTTLTSTSRSENELIRRVTAFALGRIRTPEAEQLLEVLVDDPSSDTRFNAARGLAAMGNPKGYDALVEMLDVSEMSYLDAEENPNAKIMKRALLIKNGQEGIEALLNAGVEIDLAPVREQLQRIVDATPDELTEWRVHPRMVFEVKRMLGELGRRGHQVDGGRVRN